jgi:hypothetical protein
MSSFCGPAWISIVPKYYSTMCETLCQHSEETELPILVNAS